MRPSLPKTATPAASWSSVRAFDSVDLLQLQAHRLHLGDVERAADRAVLDRHVEHFELPALAGDDRRRAVIEGSAEARRLADRLARPDRQQLDPGGQHRLLAFRLHRAGVGGVHPGQPAGAVAPPERDRQHVGERAERRHLVDDVDRLLLQLGEGAALAGQLAKAQDRAAAAGAAARLEQRAAGRADGDLKCLAVAAELVGRGFERSRRFRG